ncbi:MAG: S8 family serine peptidase [Gemmatimonadota bacterium]
MIAARTSFGPIRIPAALRGRALRTSTLAAGLFGSVLAGCASNPTPTTAPVPATAPVPTPTTSPVAGTPSAAGLRPAPRTEAQPNWHRLDLEQDGVLGVGSERALRELLAGRRPARKIVVAVIDGGVDTAHTMLSSVLWRNAKETAGNTRDDEGNGYIDDVIGWNYAGGKNGQSVHHDTFEMTRLYAACKGLPAGAGIAKPGSNDCVAVATDYAKKRTEISGTLQQITNLTSALEGTSKALRDAMRVESLTVANVRAFKPSTQGTDQARSMWLQLADNGLSAKELAEAKKAYDSQFKFGLDTMFNPRGIVGDSAGVLPRGYGNRDVAGPDPMHGTHVSGIIGARRDGGDVQGIAPDVSIMALRAVPDGDERDQDIANAIRYAADNGANIINMSFGKGYSPQKPAVDSAVRYAESKGVLMVHAAGNDGDNIDVSPSFPSPNFVGGGRASTWIEVGASSWKGGGDIAAPFSNFGRQGVDLFAPGVDILSTLPGSTTGKESGTSMAAPVVSGVAALLMSYFPSMTAAEVKGVLVESTRKLGDLDVTAPGDQGRIKFSALSRSGGVVDAFAAVKLALQRENVRP